jgi:hypothetical protein
MKIFCHVHGKQSVVVGYGPGRKGRPMAIVLTDGKLKAIRLKDIVLDKPDENVVLMRKNEK